MGAADSLVAALRSVAPFRGLLSDATTRFPLARASGQQTDTPSGFMKTSPVARWCNFFPYIKKGVPARRSKKSWTGGSTWTTVRSPFGQGLCVARQPIGHFCSLVPVNL